jgi:hypothetical protein
LTSSLKVNVFSKSRDGREELEEESVLGREDMLVEPLCGDEANIRDDMHFT